jgi:hypothetical protein
MLMTEATTGGPAAPAISRFELAALLALASGREVEESEVATKARIGSRFKPTLDAMHKKYMVDIVSSLRGSEVVSYLKLTEHGSRLLMAALETMCELPER